MNNLKANYTCTNIKFKQIHHSHKIYFIFSNYTKKICGNATYVQYDKTPKNIVIPNSVQYIDDTLICKTFNFKVTNKLKSYMYFNNLNKNKTTFEYLLNHNSSRQKKYYYNMTNIIFQHMMVVVYNEKQYKNIFLFENIHSFRLCDNMSAFNRKNIVVFKNVKIIELLYVHRNVKNLLILRNIYDLYLGTCSIKNTFDASVLCNVFIIDIESNDNIVNINKLTINNTFIIESFQKEDDDNLKFNFMYITKLIIDNANILQHINTTGTVRILCLAKHNYNQITNKTKTKTKNKTTNKTTNKYVDHYRFL